jgi:poly(3-hydroxybutyrate) depolymerase
VLRPSLALAVLLAACGPDDASQPLPKDAPRCTDADADHVTCAHQGVDLQLSGGARHVHFQVPAGDAPAAGWPVVIMFQGSYLRAELTWESARGDEFGRFFMAKTLEALLNDGYAVLTPDTLLGGNSFWNTNIPPYATMWDGAPDDTLMKAMFTAIGDGTFGTLDGTRLYATGISSGGFMTSRMAVSYPGKFKSLAIASGSYATCSETCDVPDTLPADHPPTLFLHGQKDNIVPIGTMWPYQMKLQAQGTQTSTEIDENVGHAWLEAGIKRVPAWFDATP